MDMKFQEAGDDVFWLNFSGEKRGPRVVSHTVSHILFLGAIFPVEVCRIVKNENADFHTWVQSNS